MTCSQAESFVTGSAVGVGRVVLDECRPWCPFV